MDQSREFAATQQSAADNVGGVARFVAAAATRAPSVHNTQPWWFSTGDHEITVHADRDRQLRLADPDGRELLISCGAAVFTARVALRYLGLLPEVSVLPDSMLPNLVARISWTKRSPTARYERELFTQVERRRTHRGGFDREPLPDSLLAVLRDEAEREHATLRMLGDDGRACLAAVVTAAEYALRQDAALVRESALWAPSPRSRRRDGCRPRRIPPYPSRPSPTSRPGTSRTDVAGDCHPPIHRAGPGTRGWQQCSAPPMTSRETGSTRARRCSGCCSALAPAACRRHCTASRLRYRNFATSSGGGLLAVTPRWCSGSAPPVSAPPASAATSRTCCCNPQGDACNQRRGASNQQGGVLSVPAPSAIGPSSGARFSDRTARPGLPVDLPDS